MASTRNGRSARHTTAAVAFTQVELLVVIGIIAMLAAVLLPSAESARSDDKPGRGAAAQARHVGQTVSAVSQPKVRSSPTASVLNDLRMTTSATMPTAHVNASVAVTGPPNDLCTDAIHVAVPSSTAGTTVDATIDVGFPSPCGDDDGIFAPGVWYSVTGTGHTMSATTCNAATNYDSQLTVYCPNCATPQCVTGNDDACGPSPGYQSRVTWCSQLGQTYFILVHGYDVLDVGPFQLDVSTNGVACSPPVDCQPPSPCDLTCGPNQIPENEANCGLPNDTINGGCNSTPNVFLPIACGESYCGTAAFNGSARDTDWYKLVLAAPTTVTWTVSAEFAFLAGVVETAGVDSCLGVSGFRAFDFGSACETVSVISNLPAGTWYLFVAPDFAGPVVPCGRIYRAALTCEDEPETSCCLPDGTCRSEVTPSDCRQAGGVPLGPTSGCQGDHNSDGIDDACFAEPCAQCGPGQHWIHNPPCPPGGTGSDTLPSGAVAGIDLNDDCIADVNFVVGGPVTIRKRGPFDDSGQYPGLRPVDGHLDVIDTEIVAMTLTGGGVTLVAGAGLGATPLLPSRGTVAEQGGNPALADSFFDVFFEIEYAPGQYAYNRTAVRVQTVIECLPPDGIYAHVTGCLPLFTSPHPGQGTFVGNLVSANHFTYPGCCFGDQCHELPTQVCEGEGGKVVPSCLGDADDNGVDDACEQGACCIPSCGPGGVCPAIENCQGNPTCYCFRIAEDGGNCASDFFCNEHLNCPNGNSDCPPGEVCYVETCCTVPTCGPAECETPSTAAPLDPNTGPTAGGGPSEVSGNPNPVSECVETTRVRCENLGGVFQGAHTVCTPETCAPGAVEIDRFPNTTAQMDLQLPDGTSYLIDLSGPTTVHVFFEGPVEGMADDDNGNNLDEVRTEMVDMQLTGLSPVGPVLVRLHPTKPSRGIIEETVDTQTGRLDVPPFAPNGTANSFFDVFFEIHVQGLVFHTQEPKRMSSVITHKPPAPGDTYENPDKIPLLDEFGNETGITIGAGSHTPNPKCGSPGTGDCYAPHESPFCNNERCCECVCAEVPACCEEGWTLNCAELARLICVQPTVVKWESVVTHTGPAPPNGPVGPVALEILATGFSEPRSAVSTIVVTFDHPIDPDSADADNVNLCGRNLDGPLDLSGIAISVGLSPDNTKMEIKFDPGLPNYARYSISLKGLRGRCGGLVKAGTGGLSRVFTALQGDYTNDRRVNATDLGGVRNLVPTNPINPATLNEVRGDPNSSGNINATDLGLIRGRVGQDAREIPDPVCP